MAWQSVNGVAVTATNSERETRTGGPVIPMLWALS